MSAIVCGKRSFFEDIDPEAPSPPAFKKYRCSSAASPVGFGYSAPFQASPADQLKALFPNIDIQLLEKALEESGSNLDLAIANLQDLCSGDSKYKRGSYDEEKSSTEKFPMQEPHAQYSLPGDGAEWVDLFIREMTSATSIDDARARAASVLERLEKSIASRARAETAQSVTKENDMLKEQIEALLRDNAILKRAVAIQYERQKEHDERNQEVEQLKQLVSQYQEQLRTLEVNNYALRLHLRQAQSSNSIPGRFHPDVF